jgi:hypothetical protein
MRHRSYRLVNVQSATLKQLQSLVGAEVEVRGKTPVEGFPSGDKPVEPDSGRESIDSAMTLLSVEAVRKLADVCLPDHLSTPE